ncbi:hypothetical protein [Nonomuraea rubra]|uniref:hypothetical protein n=1 Tax=Nonomuraea rubra TaxID=46180 RepID=UPI0033E4CDAE
MDGEVRVEAETEPTGTTTAQPHQIAHRLLTQLVGDQAEGQCPYQIRLRRRFDPAAEDELAARLDERR